MTPPRKCLCHITGVGALVAVGCSVCGWAQLCGNYQTAVKAAEQHDKVDRTTPIPPEASR